MIGHLFLQSETDIEENSSELLLAVNFELDDISSITALRSSCCASKPVTQVRRSDLSSHNSTASTDYGLSYLN